MVTAKLYVEGGGDEHLLRSECRRGFCEFLKKAGLSGHLPRIVACGGRQSAYERFCIAHTSGEMAFLLVDSEDVVTTSSPWEHLKNRKVDRFDMPKNSSDDQCHLMVVCMESWFLADKNALEEYFGTGFNSDKLPKSTNIETISKTTLFSSLENATRGSKKGIYTKGGHSFNILCNLSPENVRRVSPWADRFISVLVSRLA